MGQSGIVDVVTGKMFIGFPFAPKSASVEVVTLLFNYYRQDVENRTKLPFTAIFNLLRKCEMFILLFFTLGLVSVKCSKEKYYMRQRIKENLLLLAVFLFKNLPLKFLIFKLRILITNIYSF